MAVEASMLRLALPRVRPSPDGGLRLGARYRRDIREVVSMRRFFVLFTVGAAFAALGAVACGDGNKPPPLTPDTEHPADGADAGAATPSAAPATPEQ
jgi:hypothetical protein